MRKQLIVSLFLVVVSSACFAQVPERETEDVPRARKEKKKTVKETLYPLPLYIRADHDFYLSVDDKKVRGKILANKPEKIDLTAGVHKLSFEEADSTGEAFERYLRVPVATTKQKDSLVTINFKNDFQAIMNAYPPVMAVTARNTAPTDQQVQIKAIANEIANDVILKKGGDFKTTNKNKVDGNTLQTFTVRSLNVGRHEVTQRQWQAVMGYNNSTTKDCAECPVDNVSWNEVTAFVEKLNKASGQKLRLPTEVEWEYITDKSLVDAGVVSSDPERLSQLRKSTVEESAWYGGRKAQPVGTKAAISGVFDLFGNVAEWCADDNGSAASASQKKVFKGGSYKDKEEALRILGRGTSTPNEKLPAVGFRLVTNAD